MMVKDPSGLETDFEQSASIEVEVVLTLPAVQWRTSLTLTAGSRLRDALDASGVDAQLGEQRWSDFAVGVFGRLRDADAVLTDGDRVELYRPLTADPKEARRKRVRKAQR
jgi:putative ubiquitin-RnfH superfamily antitoxin RatB of RatAB toxin-antitoxin module